MEVVALTLLAVAITGCSSHSVTAAPEPESSSADREASGDSIPSELDCRGGGVVSTAGGLREEGVTLRGADSPELAVEAFLPAIGLAGKEYVVDVPEAWVLRPDGTAVARMDLLLGDGWTAHGYDRCVR